MTGDLLLVGLAMLVWGVGEGMFIFFNPLYLQQLGADPVAIGGILGAMGIAMTVAHVPAGYLADRIGRRPLLIFASTLGIPAAILMALASSLTVFVIGLLLYGLTALVVSPLNSYITGARGSFTPGRAMTLTSAMFSLGAVVGPLAGGWIGGAYGLQRTYAAAACAFVLSTLVMLFVHAQPRERHDPDAPPVNLLANRRYIGFISLVLLVLFASFLPQPLASVFLQNERGISVEQIGQLGSLNNLGVVAFNLVLGQLDLRLGFLLGQSAVAVFTLLLWQGKGMAWFAPAYFLLAGNRVIRPLISAQVRELVHGSQMGLAYGITETIGALPNMIAPPIAGLIYSRDPAAIFTWSLALIAIGLVVSLRFAPRPPAASGPLAQPAGMRDDLFP